MRRPTPLPADLTIYTVGELRTQWLAMLDKGAKATPKHLGRFDGAAVDQVDAAGMQLLVALSHSLEQRQRRLQLTDPSPALRSACESLGMAHLLDDAAAAQGASS